MSEETQKEIVPNSKGIFGVTITADREFIPFSTRYAPTNSIVDPDTDTRMPETITASGPSSKLPVKVTPSIKVGGWQIFTNRQPILSSDEIDQLTDELGFPLPEMIFGHNMLKIEHEASGWCISFDTVNALKQVDHTGDRDGGIVQVSYAQKWMKSRSTTSEEDVKGIVKPYDWTYSTVYTGDVDQNHELQFEATEKRIPFNRLKRPDPILFFDDMILYEDELGDNGASILQVKLRVMPARLLLLCRFFLRVDDVLFRIRDTRVFIEFKDGTVIREYKEQEDTYQNVCKQLNPFTKDPKAPLRDSKWVSEHLPIIKTILEKVTVK